MVQRKYSSPKPVHAIYTVKCSDYPSILHLSVAGVLKKHFDIYSDDKWEKAHVMS